jgi:hypothetical protein
MKDTIEIYEAKSDTRIATVETSFRVEVGDKISIKGITYKVIYAAYALDYSDEGKDRRQLRCNLTVVTL